jgi:hypothetical protein
MSPELAMDETAYWDLLNSISSADSLAALAALEQQVRAAPSGERRANLGEVLFMQRRLLEASAERKRTNSDASPARQAS